MPEMPEPGPFTHWLEDADGPMDPWSKEARAMRLPLLLGMCNPLSDDPEYDLYPYPEGSAGHRLWKLLPEGTTRRQYLDAFERRNLLRAREWSQPAAREAARALLPDLHGRLVVVLGTQVRAALGLSPAEPLSFQRTILPLGGSGDRSASFSWVPLPHPSGRNLWYNDAANRQRAGDVLDRLMLGLVTPPGYAL